MDSAHVYLAAEQLNGVFGIRETITLEGDLDAAQRTRLMEIAARCPVHRTLTGSVQIDPVEGDVR